MSRLLAVLMFGCLLPLVLPGEEALDRARRVYDDSIASMREEAEVDRGALREKYTERLSLLSERYREEGDLAGVLLVKEEVEAVESGEALPPLPAEAPDGLARMRDILREREAAIEQDFEDQRRDLTRAYVQHLDTLKRDLTRSNRIDEAMEVMAEIERVRIPEPDAPETPGPDSPPGEVTEVAWNAGRDGKRIPAGDGEGFPLEVRGNASITLRGADLKGGHVLAEEAGAAISKACRARNQLTLEARFTTANVKQGGPARIVSISRDSGTRNFTLGQAERNLVLRLRTSEHGGNGFTFDLGELVVNQSTKVVFTYTPGNPVCFRDGKEVDLNPVGGDFSNWEEGMPLLMGDELDGGRAWEGTVSAFRISSEALDDPSAKHTSSVP